MLRLCEERDSAAIYRLICLLEDTCFDQKLFHSIYQQKLNDNAYTCFAAVEQEKLIGFLCIRIDTQLHHVAKVATIEELVTDPDNRSKGIGAQLLTDAIALAKKEHCEVIELTSNLTRTRAHAFYLRNGFTNSSYKFKMVL